MWLRGRHGTPGAVAHCFSARHHEKWQDRRVAARWDRLPLSLLGLIELLLVFAFAIGWGILELICLRLDKRREREAAQSRKRDG
jgi:hypothetical protein